MLMHLSVYVLAAMLLFQGVNLLGERKGPTGVVPAEVGPSTRFASVWGGLLVACGCLLALANLASHTVEGLAGIVVDLRGIGFAMLAVYGLCLLFSRKVDYRPAPLAAGDAHSH